MPTEIVPQINAITNVILGVILSITSFKCSKQSATPFYRFVRYAYGVLGIYWSLFYFATLIGFFLPYNAVTVGQTLIRPTITFMLTLLCVEMIWKNKISGGCKK